MPGAQDRPDHGAVLLPDRPAASEPPGRAESPPESPAGSTGWSAVPWRTIVASVAVVGTTLLGLWALYLASHVVVLVVVSGFFAVVLARPVAALQRRCRVRRGLAVGLVVGVTLGLVAGLLALFFVPLRSQLLNVATDLPGTVEEAGRGEGPWGRVVSGLHLESVVQRNEARITEALSSLEASVPSMITEAAGALVAVVTVVVMTCLLLTQSRALGDLATRLVPRRHRDWVTDAGRDAARAISGYMIGNLIISACAGLSAFVVLVILGAPNPAVIALWVAVADLVPLVGATIGAVVAVLAALLVSPTAGVVALVFFVLYQQFENSVLQVVVMARTVRVNPLVVLLSVLVGVELFGILGALLAVPVTGAGLVVAKEVWAHRPGAGGELVVVERIGARRRRRRERAARHPVETAPTP
ncbi:MAG: AI-2E family transporter [Acidimicrobiales bacterium]